MIKYGATGILGVVFSIIGLVSLAVAVWLGHDLYRDRQTHVHVQGTVVGNQKRCSKGCTWRPVVEFDVDGQPHQVVGVVGNSDPVFDEGETVTVLYPAGAPEDARIDHWTESLFGVLFGGGFFLIFGGIGLPMLFLTVRRIRWMRWAERFGTPVQTQFTDVQHDTRVKVNGRSPYRVHSQWQNPRDGRVYTFMSDPMWVHPGPFLKDRPQITVKLDPDRPQRYWMDLRFVPAAVLQR